MKYLHLRRPSASMIVALIALVVAASGTAVAASKLINGNSLIKPGTLSGNRLHRHTLTGAQINLRKLGKVPSARNADHALTANEATNALTANNATNATNATNALTADSATNATNANNALTADVATNATTAANLTGLTRFKTTIQPAGTSYSNAAVVTLATSGPLSLLGECYSSAGALTGGLFLSTTANAMYDAYSNQTSGAALTPGTPEDVAYNDASSTPPAIDFQGPSDGTFGAITDNASNYITGLASVGTNLNSSGGCTFAGYTVTS